MTNLENLSKSEIIQLIGKYTMGWNVSWTDYDRAKVVETIEHNPFIGAILNKIGRAASNVNTMAGITKEDTFEELPDSEMAQIIYKPSPIMSLKEMKRNMAIMFYSFGECFIYFERLELGGNNNGKIIPGTIYLISPELVGIKHKNLIPLEYVINGDFNKTVKAENIIHLKTFNPKYDDLHGLSPIKVAGILIDKLLAANSTETKTFQNSGPAFLVSPKQPDGLTPEENLSFMQKLRRAWSKPSNKRGVITTSGIVDVNPLGSTPVDMGTVESQTATIRLLLVLWGLDPGLFDIEASTMNNKAVMERAIYTECAIPFIEDFCEKFNDKFETIYKTKLISDTSNIEALQPNLKEKVDWMVTANVFTDNEIREALGYSKIEGSGDDTPNDRLTTQSVVGFKPEDLNNPVV